MALTIIVRSAEGTSLPRITFDAPRVVIGRSEGCEVRLPDPSVSLRHASIRQRGSDYIILDEGSTNGTFVGGVRLSPQAPRILKSGDLVRVGRVWLEALLEPGLPTRNLPVATREMALVLVADALTLEGVPVFPKIRVVEGPSAGTELTMAVADRVYVVGRSRTADLDLDDGDLSRRHLELARKGDEIVIRDLGSKNGSSLDDKPLAPNQDTPWRRGAVLTVGHSRLTCHDPVAQALEDIERAADERMPPNEVIRPPRTDRPPSPDPLPAPPPDWIPAAAPPSLADAITTIPSRRSPPSSATLPPRSAPPASRAPASRAPASRAPASSTRNGWSSTDLLVALLALGVLILSAVGLYVLVRGN